MLRRYFLFLKRRCGLKFRYFNGNTYGTSEIFGLSLFPICVSAGRTAKCRGFARHQLLREHVRQERGRHRIRPEDNPKKTPFTTAQLLARAGRAGTHIGAFCQAIHQHQGETGIRRILGVLSLAKKFGVPAVEDACAAALELRVYEYRFIRRYLERRPQLTLRQVDPLIRQLTLYRDFINAKTQEQDYESD